MGRPPALRMRCVRRWSRAICSGFECHSWLSHSTHSQSSITRSRRPPSNTTCGSACQPRSLAATRTMDSVPASARASTSRNHGRHRSGSWSRNSARSCTMMCRPCRALSSVAMPSSRVARGRYCRSASTTVTRHSCRASAENRRQRRRTPGVAPTGLRGSVATSTTIGCSVTQIPRLRSALVPPRIPPARSAVTTDGFARGCASHTRLILMSSPAATARATWPLLKPRSYRRFCFAANPRLAIASLIPRMRTLCTHATACDRSGASLWRGAPVQCGHWPVNSWARHSKWSSHNELSGSCARP